MFQENQEEITKTKKLHLIVLLESKTCFQLHKISFQANIGCKCSKNVCKSFILHFHAQEVFQRTPDLNCSMLQSEVKGYSQRPTSLQLSAFSAVVNISFVKLL